MKRFLTITLLALIVLAACSTDDDELNNKTETNYYLSFSEESNHWKLEGYEIMFASGEYKAGNGILEMTNKGKARGDFFSFDVYGIIDGEENKIHSGSVSGDTDFTEMSTGTIEGEEENLKSFPKLDEIYMTVTWKDDKTDGDQEERITLYNKESMEETFLEEKE